MGKDPSIRVVIIQNTLGEACHIREIADFCQEHNLVLVEDLAHSVGLRYRSGELAGTVGDFTVLSFGQDKAIDAVSGGALISRRKKHAVHKQMPMKRVAWGQQVRDRFFPLITWCIRKTYTVGFGKILHRLCRVLQVLSQPLVVDLAYEVHALPDWYCSIAMRQYALLPVVTAHRRALMHIYATELDRQVLEPVIYDHLAESIYLRFPILVEEKDGLVAYLRQKQIYVSDVWYDAPIAPEKYLHLTSYAGECPQAEQVAKKILNLPTHRNVSPTQAHTIVREVNAWIHQTC